jgi:glycosyltransferase involved in cell wall biosynthesis
MDGKYNRLKIAYLSAHYPRDRNAWSGTKYYMAQALQKHCGDVSYIGPINSSRKRLGKIIHLSSQFFLKKNFPYNYWPPVAKKHGKIATNMLTGRSFDLIFAPIGETEIAYLETDIPIVLALDASFDLIHNYNPVFSNLLWRSAGKANMIEHLAYKKANVLLFSSKWAARSAIEDYQADKEKVYVVPLGANLDLTPPGEIAQRKRKSGRCRLLFVGRRWHAKGGGIAFETLLKLEELGIDAELIICGCTPPETFAHKRMRVIPFLDKSNQREQEELEKLYATADFLLVPTRCEAYGLVFCEANAFGLPVITTNTGGVAEVVKDGENGFILPYSARGAEYAEVIAKLYQDDQRYEELVKGSRAAFENRLNWDSWGIAVKNILLKRIASFKAPASF